MNYLVISAHPYKGSFNAAAVKAIADTLEQMGRTVRVIDLVEDGFNPVMQAEDLRLWGQGKAADPMVAPYQRAIEDADVLVFPFPVWWGTMPAILKGFCDKVLLPGWAYTAGADGSLSGLLKGKKAVVITTMQTPLSIFNEQYQNPVVGGFVNDTLRTCGLDVVSVLQIDGIVSGGRERAEQALSQIKALFA